MGIISRIADWIATPYTILLIIKDPAAPAGVKWRAIAGFILIFAYVVSPIDVIPDVIPFSGWLDDLIIVPLGFTILRLITPGIDVMEKREKAQKGVRKWIIRAVLLLSAAVLLWLAWLAFMIWALIRLITG